MRPIIRAAIAAASALPCLALAVGCLLRPDARTAATVVPIWYWAPPAAVSLVLSWRGRGWGDTRTASPPLVRIDQARVSEQWQPVSVTARPAPPSDHRMVVCDLVLSP